MDLASTTNEIVSGGVSDLVAGARNTKPPLGRD